MKQDGLQAALSEALPLLAQMTNGYGLLADGEGSVVRLAHYSGKDFSRFIGIQLPELCDAIRRRIALEFFCPADPRELMWAVPVGEYALCASACREAASIYRRLESVFEEALPKIAQIVGGEGVIFNREGVRTFSVDSVGRLNREYIGSRSASAQKAMQLQKTTVGESTYIVGAKAVRIPITTQFGIGLNNNDTVVKRQRLLEDICGNTGARAQFRDIAGEGEKILEMKRAAKALAAGAGNILITGEPGTGKALLAQAIHNAGGCEGEFVAVNCDTIEQDLICGVLFGYVDAAYKGVKHGNRDGAFKQADGGTLFLRHVDKLGSAAQRMLYNALTQGSIHPIGGTEKIACDVRVISSVCGSLLENVELGCFQRRLYALLRQNAISTVPLREMREDIPRLAEAFIQELNDAYGRFVECMESDALEVFDGYDWPNNAGEMKRCLENVYRHLDCGSTIKRIHLPESLSGGGAKQAASQGSTYDRLMRDYEAQLIRNALLKNDCSRLRTAEYLGISTTSLWRKMKALGITKI